jgi:hypothetical protein
MNKKERDEDGDRGSSEVWVWGATWLARERTMILLLTLWILEPFQVYDSCVIVADHLRE